MCEQCKKTFYITTPIYYPSDKLHIGHTYCTVATDAMARYKRLTGYDVMFLTGTDEHGQKIEDKAKAAGVTPQQFVDNIVTGEKGVLDLWKLMNISNDRFIRTTDDYHVESIQKILSGGIINKIIDCASIVGMFMIGNVAKIDWSDVEVALPCFLTIAAMPFSYSISDGIGFGIISYTLIKVCRGKFKEVPVLMYVLAALFIAMYVLSAM